MSSVWGSLDPEAVADDHRRLTSARVCR